MSLARLRERLPLIVFIFLAVIVLALAGFACACLAEHPLAAFDRALSAGMALPALVEIWAPIVPALLALGAAALVLLVLPAALSPPLLQRFLF